MPARPVAVRGVARYWDAYREALGLRHEDIDVAGRPVTVRPRVNDNKARAK